MRRHLPVLFVASLAIGGLGTAAVRTLRPAPGTRPEIAASFGTGRAAPHPCATLGALRGRERAATLRRNATKARIATLEQERTLIAGEPVDWTDDMPAAVQPAAAEAALRRAAQAAGGQVEIIECEEPPCVAVVEFTLPADSDFNPRQHALLQTLSDELEGLQFRGLTELTQTDDGYTVTVAGPIWTPGWSDDFPDDHDRVQFRIDAATRMAEEE